MSKQQYQMSVAPLQWASDTAKGQTEKLVWVDATIHSYSPSFRCSETGEGRKYRHRSYGSYLPKSMMEAAQSAQENGEPTALEALLLLFSRMEWLIASRKYLWSPMSPLPSLLSHLVEALGVDVEIHRNDKEVLARLVARLPTWNPSRGTIHGAVELLTETVGEEISLQTASVLKEGKEPIQPDLLLEAFACHDLDWWRRRKPRQNKEEINTELTISSGFLNYQVTEEAVQLHPEDILVGWKLSEKFPTNLLRLLPAWISVRVVVLPEELNEA
jgi:hypothetical protein